MPKEGYVPESFARAVVSEALHFTSINWERLDAKKWQIRDARSTVIQYKEGEENFDLPICGPNKFGGRDPTDARWAEGT